MSSCRQYLHICISRSSVSVFFHGVQKFSWYHEDLWCLLRFLLSLFISFFLLYFCFIALVLICSPPSPSAHKETTQECPNCDECSTDNGCVRCAEKLFLLLERKGMSHHGTCVQTCPAGHYGLRGLGVSHCMSMLFYVQRSLSLTDIKLHKRTLPWNPN